MTKHKIFETKDDKIYCLYDSHLILEQSAVEQLDDGNLNVFLFGSIMTIETGIPMEAYTITLGSKVTIPIFRNDQIVKEDERYIRLNFMKGDVFINDKYLAMSIDNVYKMFNMIMGGNLSKYIDYDKYYNITLNNMNLNEPLGFPKILLEMMLGEMFVDEQGNKLRWGDGTIKKGIPASVDDIIQTNGTFNSMIHEDPTKSILINKGKTKTEQIQESKVETYFRK